MGVGLTLKELLDSREKRVWHQQHLLKTYGGVLVSTTLNIPGPVKDKPEYRKVMEWGMKQLEAALRESMPCDTVSGESIQMLFSEIRFLKTGAEGYICLGNVSSEEVKRIAVSIETLEPRARLLDIDVITEGGSVSRSQLGLAPRKCLLCDCDAKACARSQKHSMEELLAKVDELCYN